MRRLGGAPAPPRSLPTSTQMSRPTVSASSIGPIGMPKPTAASSTVSGAMPSSTACIAAMRYGASSRLTRKPGALFTGSGSLSIWRTNAAACATMLSRVSLPDHDLDEHHLRHGIEEVEPDERDRVGERLRDLLQRDARRIGREHRVRPAPSSPPPRTAARLASTFSKIASMITSARATPSPATSGMRRSCASRTRRGIAAGDRRRACPRASSRARCARRSGPAA